ncbi:MAG: hypothetical protein AB7N80_13265 [Bdellovibrionales bacterium]
MLNQARMLLFMGLVFQAAVGFAGEKECLPVQSLAFNMREMSHLADRLYAGYNDEGRTAEMIDSLHKLRAFLAQALLQTPSKLQSMPGPLLDAQKLEYQEHIASLIKLSLTLERAFLVAPTNDEQKYRRRQVIANTLTQMNQIIGAGHERFRNR